MDCGVLEHDMNCLCDVIITEPTPVNYGLEDHWLLSMVAEHFDFHLFNSGKEFGSLLEKCDKFLNAYFDEENLGVPVTSKFRLVRDKAEFIVASHNGDLTPTELCQQLGMEEEEFVKCMSYGKPKGNTLERMDKFVRLRKEGVTHTRACGIMQVKNKTRHTGLYGWLSRTFVDPYEQEKT